MMESKCPYCSEDSEGYVKMHGAFSISNPFHRGEYYLTCGKSKPRKINYCFMCGRNLRSEQEGKS